MIFDTTNFARDIGLSMERNKKHIKKQQLDDLLARGVITKEQAADEHLRIAVEFSDTVDQIIGMDLTNKSSEK